MKDPNDITTYRKSIEQQWVHIFLVGLDGNFEQVRGEILHKDSVPELEECYHTSFSLILAFIVMFVSWQKVIILHFH